MGACNSGTQAAKGPQLCHMGIPPLRLGAPAKKSADMLGGHSLAPNT